jgi:hypothetical protein
MSNKQMTREEFMREPSKAFTGGSVDIMDEEGKVRMTICCPLEIHQDEVEELRTKLNELRTKHISVIHKYKKLYEACKPFVELSAEFRAWSEQCEWCDVGDDCPRHPSNEETGL